MEQYSNEPFIVNKVIVHAGNFHADDVFCVASMKIINPKVEVERITNTESDETALEAGIIMADIGGGRFDHHQTAVPDRYDNIKHCAFSRLWLAAGKTIVRAVCVDIAEEQLNETANGVYDGLIRSISAEDNGIELNPNGVYSIGHMISCFIPEWNDDSDIEVRFCEAVQMAETILRNDIKNCYSVAVARENVRCALADMDDGILVLDKYMPWEKEVCAAAAAKAVVFPSRRNDYNLQLVPIEEGSFVTRIQVPQNWKGTRGEDAEDRQKGMTFCHASGFLSCYKTRQDALNAARFLMEWNRKG